MKSLQENIESTFNKEIGNIESVNVINDYVFVKSGQHEYWARVINENKLKKTRGVVWRLEVYN